MISLPSPEGVLKYRNDPYSLELLPSHTLYDENATVILGAKTHNPLNNINSVASPTHSTVSSASPSSTTKRRGETKFAAVNFKFGSGIYVAPFKCTKGDRVVCETDGNGEAMGVVSEILKERPPMRIRRRLVRHARTKDMESFAQCIYAETPAMSAAQAVFDECGIPATMEGCEWQMDKTAFIAVIRFDEPSMTEMLNRILVEMFVCRVWIIQAPDNWQLQDLPALAPPSTLPCPASLAASCSEGLTNTSLSFRSGSASNSSRASFSHGETPSPLPEPLMLDAIAPEPL